MFSAPAPITSAHDVADFDCGHSALNEFLVKYALANTSAGLARTYVVTLVHQPAVVGYFSIAAGSVEKENVPGRVAKGTPRHPIPVALLARLAVDLKYQGQGLGKGLLQQALVKILDASRTIGIRAVLVHAKNQRAADFYSQYGFTPSPTNPFHMMLMLKDVIKTIEPQTPASSDQ
jgi:GNAT superfamily N-acetyltransferase